MRIPRLFHSHSTVLKKDIADATEAFERRLTEKMECLERKNKDLEREWADVYDKLMLLYDRTRKRIAYLKKLSGEEKPMEAEPVLAERAQTPEDLLRAFDARNGM